MSRRKQDRPQHCMHGEVSAAANYSQSSTMQPRESCKSSSTFVEDELHDVLTLCRAFFAEVTVRKLQVPIVLCVLPYIGAVEYPHADTYTAGGFDLH